MAYSYSEHPSVGVGQTLPLGFLYEPTSTVRVLVDGVLVSESLYFWSSNTEITTLTGFPAGAVTKVERFTPIDEYNAQNGTSVYDFEGVNLNFQQLLYALQESRDNEDLRQQQIDDIEDTAEALALGLAQVDQIKADVEDLAQAAEDSAALAATFDPANFYTKGQADARYYTQSQVNTFLSTKADNLITVTGSGLATGGGSLVSNRVITVPKATESQARGRSQDDVALTPLTGDKLVSERDAMLLHVRDQKSNGTDGGGAVIDGQVRTLNTVVVNNIPGASLGSNRITLPAGTYQVLGRVPCYSVGRAKAWLRVSGGSPATPVVEGSSGYTNPTQPTSIDLHIRGRFTLAVSTQLEVILHCQQAATTTGLGVGSAGANSSAVEVFTDIMIWKVD